VRRNSRRRERGFGFVAILVAITTCGAVALGIVLTNSGRLSEAETELAGQRAFQIAEAGADWGLSQVRIRNGNAPTTVETRSIAGAGSFTVRYGQGDSNRFDDDADGAVDEPDERGYVTVRSTGTAGRTSRTVQIVLKSAISFPDFQSAVQLNVTAPILDVNGNAFLISGQEHRIDGSIDATRPAKYAVTSPAPKADLIAQVGSKIASQLVGIGSLPSIGTCSPMDLDGLIDQANGAATVRVKPGNQAGIVLGAPAAGSTVIAHCAGDLKLTGNGSGAGILAVDGDLDMSGGFVWVGLVLVRGRVRMTGGGNGDRVIGGIGVVEEATAVTGATFGTSGGVQLLYSSDAIRLAAQQFSAMTIASWREVANP
jgi:hypothetical protein